MELHYSKAQGNLWRCVLDDSGRSLLPFIEPKDLETIDVREIYSYQGYFNIEHEKIIRIFSNNDDRLAVLIPYDVYMEVYGYCGIWYSDGDFKFDVVEIYQERPCPGRSILVNHDIEGQWTVIEVVYPDHTFLTPITVMHTLGRGASKAEALLATGLNMNVFEKKYPVYNAIDPNYSYEQARYTQEKVTKLENREIFVFGSNPKGMHNGAAAKLAKEQFGAIQGQGEGLQGHSYAIPTTKGGLKELKRHIDTFIDFAINNSQYTFLVTKIGCGNAGFKVEEVAPLFRFALGYSHIVLPEEFVKALNIDNKS